MTPEKTRIAESEETAVAMELQRKHVSAVTNTHATIEGLLEAVFIVQSAPRLYNKEQLPLCDSLELAVRECSLQAAKT
jgi:hypothetical protein